MRLEQEQSTRERRGTVAQIQRGERRRWRGRGWSGSTIERIESSSSAKATNEKHTRIDRSNERVSTSINGARSGLRSADGCCDSLFRHVFNGSIRSVQHDATECFLDVRVDPLGFEARL